MWNKGKFTAEEGWVEGRKESREGIVTIMREGGEARRLMRKEIESSLREGEV